MDPLGAPRRCRAKSKQSGEQCKRWSSPGKEVCYYHGGAKGSGAPKGSQNRVTHGAYLRIFKTPEANAEYLKALDELTQDPRMALLRDAATMQAAARMALAKAAVEDGL